MTQSLGDDECLIRHFGFWHKADMVFMLRDVCFRGQNGRNAEFAGWAIMARKQSVPALLRFCRLLSGPAGTQRGWTGTSTSSLLTTTQVRDNKKACCSSTNSHNATYQRTVARGLHGVLITL
jgi:hypothetical protein